MTAPLTDEALADMLARTERFKVNTDAARAANGAAPLDMRCDPDVVAALVREVRQARAEPWEERAKRAVRVAEAALADKDRTIAELQAEVQRLREVGAAVRWLVEDVATNCNLADAPFVSQEEGKRLLTLLDGDGPTSR